MTSPIHVGLAQHPKKNGLGAWSLTRMVYMSCMQSELKLKSLRQEDVRQVKCGWTSPLLRKFKIGPLSKCLETW